MDYIGKLLGGRYEIIDVVGVGGMAVVYRARCHVLNRYVAVKILKEEYAKDPDIRKRFSIESQAVAKLSHHNIVSVFDVGQENGTDYIVMELIEGITLKDYLKEKGKFTWQETVYFSSQIARALVHAHSRGIIHQDVKPQNVIILRDGTAKLMDFGIASFAATQETRVAQEAIGSVHYISPEQARGLSIDYRADIYSLGVVMYEMVTGKLPFDGDTAVQVVMQHINAKAKLPSELVAELPQGIDQIIMHAMCADVSKRYESAEQLNEDLEAIKKNPAAVFPYGIAGMSAPRKPQTPAAAPQTAPKAAPKTSVRTKTTVQEEEDEEEQSFLEKIGERPGLAAGIAVGVVVIITLFVIGALFLTGGSGDKEKVPDYKGQMIDDVLNGDAYAEDREKFELVKADETKASTEPAGTIVEQSIDPDRKVAKGTRIVLTVSDGSGTATEETEETETYTLPDFKNQTIEYAQERLDKNEIKISETIEEYSDEVASGKIIRTDPAAETKIEKGSSIAVYISKGSDKIKVESVLGKTEAAAKSTLEALGLTVATPIYTESSETAGTVIRQSIEGGQLVASGTSITLTVSTGPAETNTEDDTQQSNGSTHETDPEGPTTGENTTQGGSTEENTEQNAVTVAPAETGDGQNGTGDATSQ